MDFLRRMTAVVDYVEEHLAEDFDLSDVARIVCCDVYQFGRIFSYVVGRSFAAYVRGRRLSRAALDLREGDAKVIDIALKYGYRSPESFARAFRELHGIPPREACAPGVKLRWCPRIAFQISIKGEVDMEYRLETKGVIRGVGAVRNFGKWTVDKEAETWNGRVGEHWAFWDEYLNGGMNAEILGYGLYRPPFYQMGVLHTQENGEIVEAIGAESDGKIYPGLTAFEVPAGTWAVFTATGRLDGKEHPLDALTARIFTEWLPSSGYEKSMAYELQVYGPGDTGSDGYTCELWIPVRKKG